MTPEFRALLTTACRFHNGLESVKKPKKWGNRYRHCEIYTLKQALIDACEHKPVPEIDSKTFDISDGGKQN